MRPFLSRSHIVTVTAAMARSCSRAAASVAGAGKAPSRSSVTAPGRVPGWRGERSWLGVRANLDATDVDFYGGQRLRDANFCVVARRWAGIAAFGRRGRAAAVVRRSDAEFAFPSTRSLTRVCRWRSTIRLAANGSRGPGLATAFASECVDRLSKGAAAFASADA